MTTAAPDPIKTAEELSHASAAYQTAIRKIVRSHAVNELYGAQVFDEPAIALAPTPYAKWLTCRVAMEEYGHHVRFRELGEQIGVPAAEMTPKGKRPLSIFEFPLKSWEEFCVIKLLADLAEILQVEDLLHCTFHPLRNLARMTMPSCARPPRAAPRCRTRSTGISRCCRRFSARAARRTTRFTASSESSSVATRRCAPITSRRRARWSRTI
jgi:hypothetical protein